LVVLEGDLGDGLIVLEGYLGDGLVVLEGDLNDGLSVLEHILDLHNLDDSERFVHHEVAEGPESLR